MTSSALLHRGCPNTQYSTLNTLARVQCAQHQPTPARRSMHRISLIPGDGIGPEVTDATVRVIEAAGVQIEWDRLEAGQELMTKHGTPLPDEVLNSIARNRLALKG